MKPLLSLRDIETASNAKIYLETYFDRILASPSPRSLRRRAAERLIKELSLGPAEATRCWEEWRAKETEYLRRCRTKLHIGDFDTLRIIGKGSFGCVTLARMENGEGGVLAVKIIQKGVQLKKGQEAHLRAERDLLVAGEGSRWIVPLVASFQDDENLYLAMEYMIGGDFLEFLIEKETLSEEIARFYVAEMVLCIEEVHKLGFIHRDVKPEDNFCITASGHLKICDFGLAFSGHWAHDGAYFEQQRWGLIKKTQARMDGDTIDKRTGKALARALSTTAPTIPHGERVLSWRNKCGRRRMARSIVGTYQYMAPEIVRDQPYDARCDWWSLGVIICEILFGCTPFDAENREESKTKLLNWSGHLAFDPTTYLSQEMESLIRSLICQKEVRLGSTAYRINDASDRLPNYVYQNDAEEIRAHPFFAAVNWRTLHMQIPPFVPNGLLDETDTKYFTNNFSSTNASGDEPDALQVRAKDILLRDNECGEEILEARKRGAFLGYTYVRPGNVRTGKGLLAY
ncbi:kinase-like protein [Tuber magnatum]|uniref:non-specific serine/threonine protein kinase n=1 Tax=Tuber magnatum TaxID=42249 RepID=A0A317SSK8_9PEZI|nr:kinase-like protein [Tuber magnatum]